MLKENCIKYYHFVNQYNRYLRILWQPQKIFSFFSFVIILSFFPSYQSLALTATTSNAINGTAPYMVAEWGVVPEDLNDVLNFSVTDAEGNKKVYYGNSTLPSSYSEDAFTKQMKISDFKIMDGDNFRDDDGDTGIYIGKGKYTYIWKDRYGHIPKSYEHLQSCKAPYTLEIEAKNLKISTKYGIPLSRTYPYLYKKFVIDVKRCYLPICTPICYVKPINSTNSPEKQLARSIEADSDYNDKWGYSAQEIENNGQVLPITAVPSEGFELITRELEDTNKYYTFTIKKGGEVLSVSDGNRFTFRPSAFSKADAERFYRPPYQYTIEIKNKETNEVSEYNFQIDKWTGTVTPKSE